MAVAQSISPTTGQPYYSGSWENIQDLARTLKIGEGKVSRLTQTTVNRHQELIDRQVDGVLSALYHVPLRPFNQVQPDGTTKRIYPGELRYCALYWATGEVVLSEFQNLDPNTTEQATQLVEEARRRLFNLVRFQQRVQGQEFKSHISHTLPPSLQVGSLPESEV